MKDEKATGDDDVHDDLTESVGRCSQNRDTTDQQVI